MSSGLDSLPVNPSNGWLVGDRLPVARVQKAQHLVERSILQHELDDVLDRAELIGHDDPAPRQRMVERTNDLRENDLELQEAGRNARPGNAASVPSAFEVKTMWDDFRRKRQDWVMWRECCAN